MNFCDFCDGLDDAGNPIPGLSRAQTSDMKWICDQCYYWNICLTSSNDPNPKSQCKENPCKHQPQLITKWSSH